MHKQFKICLSTLLLAISTHALAESPKPEACPSVDAITSQELTHAEGAWVGTAVFNPFARKYDTKQAWVFVILIGDRTETEAEAVKIGNDYLPTITRMEGPILMNGTRGPWACVYGNDAQDKKFMAYSMLNSAFDEENFLSMAREFKRFK